MATASKVAPPAADADPVPPEPSRVFAVLAVDHGVLTVGTVLDLPQDLAAAQPVGMLVPATPAQVAIAFPRVLRVETL